MSFAEELHAAMDTADPLAYIDRVKTVVARELRRIDATANIEDTKYFNHSSIPDFLVTWSGQKHGRRLYLRDSYESIAAGHDGRYLTEGDPVLVSLEEADPSINDVIETVDAEAGERMLVTDVDAVSVIGDAGQAGSSPLAHVVKANFVRGARGRIDRHVAEVLVDSARTQGETPEAVEDVAAAIARNFFDDAAFQINRTATILNEASREGAAPEEVSTTLRGRLSVTELQTILPWVLTHPESVTNEQFWPQIARLTQLADLEKAQSALHDLDLTPLIDAAAELWEARWAYIGLSTPVEGDETYELRRNFWSFLRGSLGIDVGASRICIAHDGRLLPKRRGGRSTPSWESARDVLAEERISRVELQGLRRSITISAEQSPDVRADIEEVTESLDDAYFLNQLTLRVPGLPDHEGSADIEVMYDSGMLRSPAGASLADLHRLTAQVLGVSERLAEPTTVGNETDEPTPPVPSAGSDNG